MIKVVFIDIDNTLLDFNKSADTAMERAFTEHGLPFSSGVFPVFKRVNDGLWAEIERERLTRDELHKIRFNLIFKELDISYDGTKVEKSFLSALNTCAVPIEGAFEIVDYLSKKYILCSASNAPYIQQIKRLEFSGLDKFLAHVFVSESIGYDKPSKEFFAECFKSLPRDIKPGECVIIGDSISADIAGGKSYGLSTVWFNPDGADYPEGLKPDYTVTKLTDIKEIL